MSLFNQLPPDRILEIPFGPISTVSFTQQKTAVGFSSGDIIIVDNNTFEVFLLRKSQKKSIKTLLLSPDNQFLLIFLEEDKIYVYEILKEKIFKEIKLKEENPIGFEWLSGSKFVFVTNKGTIHYWDINRGKEIKVIENSHSDAEITVIVKHPRSLYTILTGDSKGEFKIWDLEENKVYPDLVNSFNTKKTLITTIAPSITGDIISVGYANGFIEIYDTRIPRGEKLLAYIHIEEQIRQIISLSQSGEFLAIYSNGSIKFFQGFAIDQINYEFQIFKNEIESFNKKLEQLPSWLSENGLDTILPSEVSLIEKNLEIALKLLSPSLLDKEISPLLRENFADFFKKFITLEERVHQIIAETKLKVQKTKEEIEKTQDITMKLEQDIILYLANQKPGKISIDQISLYLNTSNEIVLLIIQKLEQTKKIAGSIKSEYSGYFIELNPQKIDHEFQNAEFNELNMITCHKCGTDYDIGKKMCPNCKTESIMCESCSKYIQKRQMVINCPYCKAYFHLACFESKVKLFKRCPKCRELVDFDTLIKKSVDQQRQQDKAVSGLNKMISKQVSLHKQLTEKDADDDLFDF